MNDLWQLTDDGHPGVRRGLESLQRHVADRQGGDTVVGWKVGWNDVEARRQLGVRTGVVGCLFASTLLDGRTAALDGMTAPFAEVELAVRVDRLIEGREDDATLRAAVERVAPSIELLDITVLDVEAAIAANLWHRAAILGAWRPPPGGSAWSFTGSSRKGQRSGRSFEAPIGADLPDILRFVAHGARLLGDRLRPGHVVLCGNAAARAIAIRPGDSLDLDTALGALAVDLT